MDCCNSAALSLSLNAARSTLFPFLFSKCDERRFLKVINYKYIFYIIYYNIYIIIYNIDNGTRHTAKLKSQDGTAWLRGSVAVCSNTHMFILLLLNKVYLLALRSVMFMEVTHLLSYSLRTLVFSKIKGVAL